MGRGFDLPFDERQERPQTMRGRLVMRLPLQIMPGFTLPTSLLDLAAMAVRILNSQAPRSTAARADIGTEHTLMAKRIAITARIAENFVATARRSRAALRAARPSTWPTMASSSMPGERPRGIGAIG
jgi:hypothetical protein